MSQSDKTPSMHSEIQPNQITALSNNRTPVLAAPWATACDGNDRHILRQIVVLTPDDIDWAIAEIKRLELDTLLDDG